MLGTATYFSPEQAQGFALDGRSDVYALGVVLYEMLTGVAPFTAASPVSVAYKHVRETPAAPSSLTADIPGSMDRIVLTAMAKNVEERYQSAQDLRSDLLRFERGRPLVGAPVTAVQREIPSAFVAAPVVAAAPPNGGAPPPAARRKQKGRWGPIVAVGIALALLLGLIVFLLVNADIGGNDTPAATLEVPLVTGLPYSQAEAGLKALGFTVQRTDAEEPAQAPDLVLQQDPEQGRKLPKEGLITLTVSSPNITMPNVVGQARALATQTLANANLTANFVEADSDQPPGTVLATDPPAGAPVAKLPNRGAADGHGDHRAGAGGAGARRDDAGSVRGRGNAGRRRFQGDGRADPERHRAQRQRDRYRPRGGHTAAARLRGEAARVERPVAHTRPEHGGSAARAGRGVVARHPRVRPAGELRERGRRTARQGRHPEPRGRSGREGLDDRAPDRSVTLVHWYEEHGRHDLPWRRTRDRWAVLVSEVMLHQTQVPRVAAVYDDFLARFPTPAAMAAAGPGAVIEAWGRLGYPRRARRLYDAAVQIAEHGWPADLAALPGVGRYTAAAVVAQADGVDVPAIEVNIRRVVERVVGARLGRARRGGRVGAGRSTVARARPAARAHGRRRAGVQAARAALRRVPATPPVRDPWSAR